MPPTSIGRNNQEINKQGITVKRNMFVSENFKTKKKPVPAYLKEEMNLAKAASEKLAKKMLEHEKNLEKSNQHYNTEKSRLIELKESLAKN